MAVKVGNVSLSKLNNRHLGQFLSSSLEKLKENSVDRGRDTIVTQLLSNIEELLPKYRDSLQSSKKISLTKQLREADQVRDKDLLALFNHLKPLKRTRNPQKMEALLNIEDKLLPFKGIKDLSYEKETAQISYLLQALGTPESQEELKLLGAEDYYSNLKESQEDFYKLFMKATKQIERPIRPEEIRAMRQQLESNYQRLYNHLDTLLFLDQDNSYQSMIRSLNEIRYHYAQSQARSDKNVRRHKPLLTITPQAGEEVKTH